MKTKRIGFIAIAILGILAAPALAQTGHDLLQQALVKEQADGDLRAAIALYERIAREFATDAALVNAPGYTAFQVAMGSAAGGDARG